MKLILPYLIIGEWNHTGWRRDVRDFVLKFLKSEQDGIAAKVKRNWHCRTLEN